MFNHPIPINSISWAFGAFVMLFVGWRLWRAQRQTGNYLTKLFSWFFFVLGASFATYALPPFFTLDYRILLWGYLIADLGLYIAYLIQARVMWFLTLKHRIKFSRLMMILVPIALAGWIDEVLHAKLDVGYPIISYIYPPIGGLIVTLFLIIIIIPTGLVFLKEGFKAVAARKPFSFISKQFTLSTVYLLVGSLISYSNLTQQGAETVESSYFYGGVFAFMFISVLITSLVKRLRHKPAR